jgi:hypothetical protein
MTHSTQNTVMEIILGLDIMWLRCYSYARPKGGVV